MMPSGKMMVAWSVLILGPVIAEYAKCAASTVTPRTPSASAKLGRGGGFRGGCGGRREQSDAKRPAIRDIASAQGVRGGRRAARHLR